MSGVNNPPGFDSSMTSTGSATMNNRPQIPTGRYALRLDGVAFMVRINRTTSPRRWTRIYAAKADPVPAWDEVVIPTMKRLILLSLGTVDLRTASSSYTYITRRCAVCSRPTKAPHPRCLDSKYGENDEGDSNGMAQ